MKNSKYLTCDTYSPDLDICFEFVKGESKTVQGESYTIQELFDRHLKGQVVNIERESYWEDTKDFDAIDFQALKYADPYEKQMMLEDVKAKAEKAYAALTEWKKEQESKKDSDASFDDEDSPKSSKPKNQSQSGKRGAEDATSERSERRADEAAERKPS